MKKALILGVSGKMGGNIAEDLHKEGYEIFGTYHNNKPSFEHINENNLYQLDLSDKSSVLSFVKKIKEQDSFDLFVHTVANTLSFNRFENISPETFQEDLNVSITYTVLILQNVIPLLRENSSIFFILTEMLKTSPPGFFSSYVTSKYAMLGLMKSLASEYPKFRINAISPGMLDSNYVKDLPSIMKEKYKQSRGKFVEPSEVSQKLIEVLKDSSITGENIFL